MPMALRSSARRYAQAPETNPPKQGSFIGKRSVLFARIWPARTTPAMQRQSPMNSQRPQVALLHHLRRAFHPLRAILETKVTKALSREAGASLGTRQLAGLFEPSAFIMIRGKGSDKTWHTQTGPTSQATAS